MLTYFRCLTCYFFIYIPHNLLSCSEILPLLSSPPSVPMGNHGYPSAPINRPRISWPNWPLLGLITKNWNCRSFYLQALFEKQDPEAKSPNIRLHFAPHPPFNMFRTSEKDTDYLSFVFFILELILTEIGNNKINIISNV